MLVWNATAQFCLAECSRPSGLCGRHSRLDLVCLLHADGYTLGRTSPHGANQCCSLLHHYGLGIGLACQNSTDRPWNHTVHGGSTETAAHGGSTTRLALHLCRMSNLQACQDASLSHLPTLYSAHGSPLSVDEQYVLHMYSGSVVRALFVSCFYFWAHFYTHSHSLTHTYNPPSDCVGASNYKHFVLFLLYTWIGCVLALLHFGCNYFWCNDASCEFTGLEIVLVRIMTVLCLGTLVFVSTVLSNVAFSFITGEGTVDRLKQKALGEWDNSTAEPWRLRDIFGSDSIWVWWLPVDPVFADDPERVYGFVVSDNTVWQDATQAPPSLNRRHILDASVNSLDV